jgi:N-acetylneuraminic acid mutarotase
VQRQGFSLLSLLMVGWVWIVAGCGSEQPVGSARFVSRLGQALISSEVTRVAVTLSAADLETRTVDLEKVDGAWSGTMEKIPAGHERTFSAEAFGADGTRLFAGKATGVTITGGETALVAITLQQLSEPPPFENAVPVIDSLASSATAVAPGGTVTLTATAHDPNAGDVLTYAWTAPAGTFGSASSATTTWTAPAATGPVTLTLVVTDPHGASGSLSVSLTVRTGSGAARVDISFNTWPQVARITASPSRVRPGELTTMEVAASDLDGDSLTYQWNASGCSGTWSGDRAATARFSPDAIPAGGSCACKLSVTVADGHGGQGRGSLSICVGEPASPSFAPEVVESSRSPAMPMPGGTVTLRVEAKDPMGGALGFTWSANAGTLGTPVTGGSTSEVLWTAPTCVSSETPLVTVTVRNAQGLSTSHPFRFSGLVECLPHGSWSTLGGLSWGREAHTATVLPSGKVLVTGDLMSPRGLWPAEVYDPVTGLSLPTGDMVERRSFHTATLLPSGKVLVAGGGTATAELYDPATGSWSTTGSLSVARSEHTATLLPSGKVLVVGGSTGSTALHTVELYDPAKGTWSLEASTSASHQGHTATVLPSGKVLVAGGDSAVTELYDPATGTWTPTGALRSRRFWHAAALLRSGKVLVMGGSLGGGEVARSAELYDPATGTWSPTGFMVSSHNHVSAAVLPSGKVLVAGGDSDVAELYDPASGTWAPVASLAKYRQRNVLVPLPSGKVVSLGGGAGTELVEVFDPATETWATPGRVAHRAAHTATLLPSGKVLVVGGYTGPGVGLDTAELFDPVTRSWSAAGRMRGVRYWHTATLLPSGKVLVAGGQTTGDVGIDTAELYDPATGTWSPASPMGSSRAEHTATVLPSGKVLVVGGGASTSGGPLATAELYEPATDTWSPTGAPLSGHVGHTAMLLPSGKVWVVGNGGGSAAGRVAELYDPATGTWSWSAPPALPRWRHTATELPSGKVLVAGGTGEGEKAELYEPATDSWSSTGALRIPRFGHTATLLPSGKVLVVGGWPWDGVTSVEMRSDLYDPATGSWSAGKDTGSMRWNHKATLLPSGQLLVTGTAFPGWAMGMLYTP